MILDEIKEIKESKRDLRKFGLTIGIAFLLLAVLLFFTEKSSFIYFGSLGTLLIIIGLVIPQTLKPINKVWMSLSIVLGWIMTRVILTILFYLAITPIGYLAKLFRKDFLDMKIDDSKESYWQKRVKKEFDPLDYERQF
jgi:small-conductance mechanosensitive channel